MKRLGVIGGLGPLATVHYYQKLVEAGAGEMLLVHADTGRALGHVERGDLDGLASYLATLVERLANGGAEVAAVSAVTPHICIRELQAISAVPLVNVIDEIARVIRSRGYQSIALFGTRFVTTSRLFGMLNQVQVVDFPPDQAEAIHQAYMQIVRGDPSGREILIQIARDTRAEAIVLAGTVLSLVFDEESAKFPVVDCVQAHIEGIKRALLA